MKHKNDEVIRAWLDGKTIQSRYKETVWYDHFKGDGRPNLTIFDERADDEWRIKPEPKKLWVVYDNFCNIAHLTKIESEAQNFAKYYGAMYTVVEMQEVVK